MKNMMADIVENDLDVGSLLEVAQQLEYNTAAELIADSLELIIRN